MELLWIHVWIYLTLGPGNVQAKAIFINVNNNALLLNLRVT